MTEIVARLPRPRGTLRLLPALTAAAGLVLVGVGMLALRPQSAALRSHVAIARPAVTRVLPVQPLSPGADARIAADLGADAALGFDRTFFTSSPGGIFATAARVAQWRRLVARATRGTGIDPDLLEAIVFVESSGRRYAVSGTGAAGLTQLTKARARQLGLRVGRVRRHDERFAPLRELRATVHYLALEKQRLGRADLAVAAYHLGDGALRHAIAAYGGEVPSYAALYFGAAPDLRAGTWRRLQSGGDYYWKVLAAERVLRLWRHQRGALAWEAGQQARKSSAEEVMHPYATTRRFGTPSAIAAAWRTHYLRAIPRDARVTHIAIGGLFGEEAYRLGRSKRLYRALRPAALHVLLYIGKEVHELSGARRPLILTSAVRDSRYQRVLMRVNANAARTYSMHTTGYAFDIARAYSSRRQAAAFQFVLDRLAAVDAVAYIREYAAIHIAVASDADAKLALLRSAMQIGAISLR